VQAPSVTQLATDRGKLDRARASCLRTSTLVFAEFDDMNNRFYEDSFVKPFLMAAFMGGASWTTHEGVADAS